MLVSVEISGKATQRTPLPHLPDHFHSSGELCPLHAALSLPSLAAPGSLTLLLSPIRVVRNMPEQSLVQVCIHLVCHMTVT